MLHELPTMPWEMIFGADIFSINSKTLLYIVDYYSWFPVMKKAGRLSADDLIRATKFVFTEFGLPKNSIRCRHELPVRLL